MLGMTGRMAPTLAVAKTLCSRQRLHVHHGTRSQGASVELVSGAPARSVNGLLTVQREVIGILGQEQMGQEGKVAHGDGVFRGCCLCLYQR